MSYFLYPQLVSLPAAAKTVSQQKKGQNSSRVISKFTPYASMEGALRALRYTREHHIPTLGTCGGCQHMIIEYARNVLGITQADHAEEHPDAEVALITP